MINGVIKFQNLPTIEGVISVNNSHNLPIFAVVMDCFVNVLHGFLVLLIDNDLDFVFRDLFGLYVFVHKVSCLIWGFVVNVYHSIVFVVLHED